MDIKPVSIVSPLNEEEYNELLRQAVAVVEASRTQMAKQLNTVAMSSYWEIGKLLEEKKLDSKHGDGIVQRLSVDLKSKYPNMGLSPRNLWDMKKFYLRYNEGDTKLRQAVAVLPWSHNLILMGYDLSPEYIVFYANEVVSKGWSRDMLKHALKSDYHLSIQAVEQFNNFTTTLPAQQAEYANEVFRSSYNLGFIDAVEPLKAPNENPSIGIILCAEKDRLEVELALQDINKPIGVAEYQYLLPKNKLQELITAEINK